MMTITHHPDISTLMSCAAGSQPEVFAAVVASHLSQCPACAREVAKMQDIGVALFDALPPAPMGCEAPVVAARAGEADAEPERRCGELGGEVPAPLAAAARRLPREHSVGNVSRRRSGIIACRCRRQLWRSSPGQGCARDAPS